MKKSIPVNKKSRGRPKRPGGVDPVSAVRLPEDITANVDSWGASQGVSRSEAIRRLVEIGLKVKTPPRPGGNPAPRVPAQDPPPTPIEKITHPTAHPYHATPPHSP